MQVEQACIKETLSTLDASEARPDGLEVGFKQEEAGSKSVSPRPGGLWVGVEGVASEWDQGTLTEVPQLHQEKGRAV